MKSLLLLLVIGVLANAKGAPHRVEVWFLSPPTSVALERLRPKIDTLFQIAANDCVPMGEGCFHPQLGFIPGEEKDEKLGNTNIRPPTILDIDLIQCDKNYYFDLYCGKALKKVSGETEMWIDISTSLRHIDYTSNSDCKRKDFARKVQDKCKNISLYTFNTSLSPMSSLDDICTYRGSNDVDSFIRWVRASDAKRIIVITDIDEYNRKLQFFLESIGAHIRGVGITPLTVDDLGSLFSELEVLCNAGKI